VLKNHVLFQVPFLTDIKRIITVPIATSDILGIEMLAGRSMPLIFLSLSPSTCERIRKDLNMMNKQTGLYFDLSSPDDTMKRITMLPEKMTDDVKSLLTQFYGNLITELDSKTANEMLVKSTPKTSAMQQQAALQKKSSSDGTSGASTVGNKIEKYCQYPPTGTNAVSVTQVCHFTPNKQTNYKYTMCPADNATAGSWAGIALVN
jgi:hypothetical protein